MHLITPRHLIPILSSPLILALTPSSSPSTLTQLNTTLPPLLPPPPSNNLTFTGLGAPGPFCFEPTKLALVNLDSCLDAIIHVSAYLPPPVYLLSRLFKTAAVTMKGGSQVPITWTSKDKSCAVQINSIKGLDGKADAAEFSLIGAAYYASLVVENCVQSEKTSVGGRFVIADGGFFIDVRAPPAVEVGGDGGGMATA